MHLCFTTCCKRLDIYFIQLDFHPGHTELCLVWMKQEGGCCASLSQEPSPRALLFPKNTDKKDAGSWVVFLFRQISSGCDFQLTLISHVSAFSGAVPRAVALFIPGSLLQTLPYTLFTPSSCCMLQPETSHCS